MSRLRREATSDYSSEAAGGEGPAKRPVAAGFPGTTALRGGLLLLGAVGAVMLFAASFATIFEVRVVTTTALAAPIDTVQSGWERHGPALVILALLAAVMLAGAARGARPAMLAVACAGVAALLIALAWDLNGLRDVEKEVRVFYESASGSRESGYYLETLGGALLLLSGGGLLLAGRLGAADD